jgi:uncharacterized NAD(P)/FAD-binding protein YdhS
VTEDSGRILIVGGGASGAITAIALEQSGLRSTQIDIAEPRELLGEGLAYQTRDPLHRLNVPTSRMSAIEALPNDFAEWSDAPSYSFMERRTYSTYLRDRLGKGITHIRDYVLDLDPQSDEQIKVGFASGMEKSYKAVVLAMGHGKARVPDFLQTLPDSPRIIRDVWDGSELPESQALICFGTGLTFIDIAMTHLSRNAHNRVIAISGSGSLPERHQQSPITPFTPTVEEVSTLTKLRTYLADAGEHWREAIDGLRPITEAMWRGFTPQEREEFLRTDGSAWSRRRHRIAPDIAERVDAEISSGRIAVIKGKVAAVDFTDTEVDLDLADGSTITGDYLAICIGRAYELSDPLSTSLINNGLTLPGPLGMGLSVDVSTGLLQKLDGTSYSSIYAIGPLRSGEAFESTAIPEIRKQASGIAERIASN